MNNKERKKEKKKMSKKVKIPLIIVGVIVVAFVGLLGTKFIMTWNDGMNMFTGESTDGGASMEANSSAPDVELDYEGMFSERDLEQEADLDEATTLTLVNGKDTVIDREGVYVLTGEYTESMIIVDADDKAKVQLVLDGLTIENQSKPAVYVKSADKVFVTTTDSYNEFRVTSEFQPDGETNLDVSVFSKADIVFNGLGTLDIRSEKGNGISTKDDLKVTGGTLNVVALDDGLEANDSIRIYDGVLNIASSNDAMHSEHDEDESLGYIYIKDGVIDIAAGDDAIRGNSAIVIDGGVIDIDSCTEGLEATQVIINVGEISLYSIDDGINATAKTSYRVAIEINGGTVNVEMADGDTDGLDSNGDLTINGGEINVIGGMAAFDIDGVIAFNNGDVYVDGVAQEVIETQQIGFMSKFKAN